jgi:DNA-binding NarL/FixJ family response regulator
MIRILLADDHPIVRDGLRAVLSTQADFAVVGEAESGVQVLAQVITLQPDILLLDLEMPDGDGVATLQRLAESWATVRVIIFTAFDTDDRIVEAVRAGAKGYLLKGAPRAELFNAIRVVHNGGSLLQPVIASKLISRLTQPVTMPEPLTAR